MSHFLDRLTYFSQPRESFSDGHGQTNGFAAPVGMRQRGRQMAFVDDVDDIGQCHHLIQILGNQQNGGPCVACRDQAIVDKGHSADIKAAHRLVRQNDPGGGFERAAQNDFLHVAA